MAFKIPDDLRMKIIAQRQAEADVRAAFASLTDNELASAAASWMQHCEQPKDIEPNTVVYDSTFWHAIVPEMIGRLGGKSQAEACEGRETGSAEAAPPALLPANEPSALSQGDLRDILRKLGDDAMHGSGQVYELYQQRLDRAVDSKASRLPDQDAAALLALAAAEFGYLPDGGNEIKVDSQTCSCGLDAMTCPNGHFEYDD